MNHFSSIKEKRRFYQQSFGPKKDILNAHEMKSVSKHHIAPVNDRLTQKEIDKLLTVTESLAARKEVTKQHGSAVMVPYFTNDITPIHMFKESRNSSKNRHYITIQDISIGMIAAMKKMTVKEFKEREDPQSIMLILHEPIFTDVETNQSSLVWDNNYVEKKNYTEYHITDPILYTLAKRYSREAITVSNSTDIYLLGMDLRFETEKIDFSQIESAFKTIAKTVFVTSLLSSNNTELGIIEYPLYNFAVGTYNLDLNHVTKFYAVTKNNTLLYVLPLWQNVVDLSYTLELPSTKYSFTHETDTILTEYPRLDNPSLPNTNPRNYRSNIVATKVVLHPEKEELTQRDVYHANLYIRDQLSIKFDNVRNYNHIKDRMYPKSRRGARTKLESILREINYEHFRSVLDIGSAPGTWLELLMEMQNFQQIMGITSRSPGSLSMYKNILDRIHASPNVAFKYADIITFDKSTLPHFDLIVSDAAEKKQDYLSQSSQHDLLFTKILGLVDHLNVGGTLVQKIYDVTDKLYKHIDALKNDFTHITLFKPYGSCPTNSEQYVVFQGYRQGCTDLKEFDSKMVEILHSQIFHLHNLYVNGFEGKAVHNAFYYNNRLSLESIKHLPADLYVTLRNLKFSNHLFPEYLEGVMIEETTNMGDQYIRLQWCVPEYPFEGKKYIYETSIGKATNTAHIQNPIIFHFGFVIERGLRKQFILLDKNISSLVSEDFHDIYVTDVHIPDMTIRQVKFEELLLRNKFHFLFPRIYDFYSFRSAFKYLSLEHVLQFVNRESPFMLSTVLNQFFREAECMHLSYKRYNDQTYVEKRSGGFNKKAIKLSTNEGRAYFWKLYQENQKTSRSLGQIFSSMLDQHSFKIPDNELLQSSACYISTAFKERQTGQICVSQPACNQYRRQIYV